jgi:hypothetical protein
MFQGFKAFEALKEARNQGSKEARKKEGKEARKTKARKKKASGNPAIEPRQYLYSSGLRFFGVRRSLKN